MTIRPTQLIASVTTTAMQTVKSVCVFCVGMPRDDASCGCTAVKNSRFEAKTHKTRTPSSTSASLPISPGVTERMSPMRYLLNFVKLLPPSVAMKMPRATAVEEKTPMIVSADCRDRLRTNENRSANKTARPTAQPIGCTAPHRTPTAMPVKPEWPSASEKKLIRPVTIIVERWPKSGAIMRTASSAFFINVICKKETFRPSQIEYQRLMSHLPDETPSRIPRN